jgi:hypothetical protein
MASRGSVFGHKINRGSQASSQAGSISEGASVNKFDECLFIVVQSSDQRQARTSTMLSKNVAPPPMSVKADDVVLLALPPPGVSLFQ